MVPEKNKQKKILKMKKMKNDRSFCKEFFCASYARAIKICGVVYEI